MPGSRYSFLDLTVLAELRRRMLSAEATILFAGDLEGVLWANAPGAALFGGTDLAELIELPLSHSQPFVRQLRDAATQIEDSEPLVRGFRVARGLKTEFIQCELSRMHLPAGEEAVLLVCTEDRLKRPAREHELAARAVDSLTGLASAAAIVDDYGLAIAATESFAEIDIAPEDLGILIEEAAGEHDRLVKRVMETADGDTIAVGVARLRERPGRYLLVCAQAGEEAGEETHEILGATSDDAAALASAAAMVNQQLETETLPEAAEAEAGVPEAVVADEHAGAPQAEPVAFDGERRELVPPEGWEDDEAETSETALPEAMAVAAPEAHDDAQEDETHAEDGHEVDMPVDDVPADAARERVEPDAEGRPSKPVTAQRKPSLLDRWYLGMGGQTGETEKAARLADAEEREAPADDAPHEDTAAEADTGADRDEPVLEAPVAFAEEPAREDFEEEAEESVDADQESKPELELTPESEPEAEEAESGPDDVAAMPAVSEAESSESAGFVFSGEGDPVRFAWIIDSDQTFRSVSPELAQTVGPNAADIVGRKWGEVAAVFGFDNMGEIRRLLERRDTWSGKSVLWPVQGTDLVVPIDLAALPAFDAMRRFDGFRGFGIIRVSDAVIDPNETGLALAPNRPGNGESEQADTRAEETKEESAGEAVEDRRISGHAGGAENGWERSSAANVVQLRNRSQTDTQEELSRRESQAFSEIGRTLRNGEEAPGTPAQTPANGEADQDETASTTDTIEDEERLAEDRETEERDDTRTADNEVESEATQASDASEPGSEEEEDEAVDDAGDAASEPAEESVAAEERRGTNSILEQLPVPVLIYRNGVTLFANPELLELTGYASIDELSRAGGVDALLSGDIEDGQATLTCKDGRRMHISPLLQTVPWDDDNGSAGKALLMSFRPAASRGGPQMEPDEKVALDLARVTELQSILDTATDGIIVVDRESTISSINASAEALFGIDHDQVAGHRLAELFAQESHQALADYMAELTQPGVASILNDGREVIGKEAKGGLIPMFITIGQVGAAEKFCVVLRDMTHWKKAEEELVKAKRAAEMASEQKTDFLARVSHEIRTPLNAIIGFSDVMLEERFGPIGNERYREYLRDINRSGVHVLDLINDLLDISKIEAGKMELSYEAVDLNQLAAETVALLQPQANRERIIIRTSLSRAVPRVVADARSIRQIILNLVSNAIKFTPENGQVIVSTVYEGNGEVALRVRDTGRGMSPAEIDSAMKPFQQLRGVEEKRGHGTGLGLPLTKALVEANRAYFDLESTPGEGTIAHVHFPTQRVLAD